MKTSPNQFVGDPMLEHLNNLTRWQGQPTHRPESVAQHSYWVTYWTAAIMAELTQTLLSKTATDHAHAITLRARAMELAIFHDVDECITGDVTHPVKYNRHNGPAIRKALKDYVAHELPNLWNTNSSYGHLAHISIQAGDDVALALSTVVKVADYLSMFNFCLHESALGNLILRKELPNIAYLVNNAMTISERVLRIDIDEYKYWDFSIYKSITVQLQEQCNQN